MALSATVHVFEIELADSDRSVFQISWSCA